MRKEDIDNLVYSEMKILWDLMIAGFWGGARGVYMGYNSLCATHNTNEILLSVHSKNRSVKKPPHFGDYNREFFDITSEEALGAMKMREMIEALRRQQNGT